MKKYGFIAFLVALIDQMIKAYVRSIPVGTVFFDIPGLFSLMHVVNTGAAFSIMAGFVPLLALISCALLGAIWIYAAKTLHLSWTGKTALAVLTGGGVGNLFDRLIYEGVTDYILLRFVEFPVFNFADIAITCSVAVLLILLFANKLEDAQEDRHESDC